ncbi:hypothetical protein TPHA_0E00410 [Tetrapisispora phaffii CBS 4417]|uniref:Peptidase M20 dimerisation domain-containing protein n=1 Tax=Tetrapisispora phaffii (strain ATCC 24235 / CBS 4417 / NBRC 1672 / NRRL Y-8282 / UCD 70-5) TaxID=1071381 RepID=G8BTA9_TETPH|nr:hypothetical protein TPHA_0E00410 [Tetrapisispora phaffii CBS 4417]CCE63137.1 hypothetical protein TPHA_0E00410 [Tetrapisispora phaffii CBS 4417]
MLTKVFYLVLSLAVGAHLFNYFLGDQFEDYLKGGTYENEMLGAAAGNKCNRYDKLLGNTEEYIFNKIVQNESYRNATAYKLARAVQVDTTIEDDYPNPEFQPDFPGWVKFKKLHAQLEKDFPLVWSNLKVETVNGYSLLLTWEGSDASLKPNLFMAHEDTVPIDNATVDQWEHAPFSGDFDGTYIWGRGSIDDKNMLIAMLESVEFILQNEPDFKPKRGLLLALGADEEISGYFGNAYIKDILLERYGEDGVYSIVDEGGIGISKLGDIWVASPATGEKGQLNLHFKVNGAGGHASVPPDHTTVGIASAIIAEIESQKFPQLYTEHNPIAKLMQCAADNSHMLPPSLKKDIRHATRDEAAKQRVLGFINRMGGKLVSYLFRTSQAATIVDGGVKANAIPETTDFNINSRISVESSVQETIDKLVSQAMVVVKKFDLGLTVLGKEILPKTANGDVIVSVLNKLEPAPVSPTNEVWSEFAGSIKGFFEDIIFPNKLQQQVDLIVAPSVMPANTDTWHYWQLTKNIYRFQPALVNLELVSHIHSSNEHIDLDTLMYAVGFFYNYIHVINK